MSWPTTTGLRTLHESLFTFKRRHGSALLDHRRLDGDAAQCVAFLCAGVLAKAGDKEGCKPSSPLSLSCSPRFPPNSPGSASGRSSTAVSGNFACAPLLLNLPSWASDQISRAIAGNLGTPAKHAMDKALTRSLSSERREKGLERFHILQTQGLTSFIRRLDFCSSSKPNSTPR